MPIRSDFFDDIRRAMARIRTPCVVALSRVEVTCHGSPHSGKSISLIGFLLRLFVVGEATRAWRRFAGGQAELG